MVRWTRAQPDGKVLVGGRFTAYRGVNRTGLARLNTNGSLDTTFNPGTGILGDPDLASVTALAIQADGQTVIGGPFYRYNGAVRHYLARVHGGAGSFPTGALRVSTSAAAGNTIPGDSTHGGDSIIYTIDYENDRPAPLARAKLSALVPAHTTPATASAGSKVTTVDGRKYVEWTLGTLAGQATGQRTFTVRVKNDAPLSSIVSGRATLSGRGASKSDSYPSLTVRNPLSVELTRESTAPVSPGDLVSYRLRVRNDASYALTAARAEQSVPQGTAFQSAFFLDASGQPTGSPIANPQGGFNPAFDARFNEVTWHLGPMAPAGEKLLRLTVRVQYDFAGSLTTGAPSVPGLKPFRQAVNRSGYAFYGQPAGSAAQLGVTGPALSFALSGQAPAARPILVLQKSFQAEGSRRDPVLGDVTSALPGGEMIVGVLAFNTGDATAERVSLRDFIPAGTAFVPGSLTVAGVPVTPGESGPYLLLTKYLLSLELGDLSAGEAVAVVYRVRIRESGENGARPVKALLLSNGYYLKTATERALTHGSPRDLHAQIVPPVTFGVEINGRQNEVMPGGALDYQIDVRNNGGVPASAVKISCRIPAGTAYESADLPAGATLTAPSAANKQTLTVHLGDLAPRDGAGDRESLGLHLRVSATLSAADVIRFNGIVATGATVTGSYLRGASAARFAARALAAPPARVADITPVRLAPQAKLFIGRSAPLEVIEGGEFTYTIFYGNLGDATATGLRIVQQVPDSAKFVRATGGGVKGDDGIVRWKALPALPGHSAAAVSVTFRAKRDGIAINDNSCDIHAANAAGKFPGPVSTTVYSGNGFVSSWQRVGSFLEAIGSQLFGGANNAIEADIATLADATRQTTIGGADFLSMRAGWFLVPLGAGQIVAGGAGNIVSNDGATIVANDGATIISGGAGNIRVSGLGALTNDVQQQLLSGIISGGAGNIVSNDGATIVSNDGATLQGK